MQFKYRGNITSNFLINILKYNIHYVKWRWCIYFITNHWILVSKIKFNWSLFQYILHFEPDHKLNAVHIFILPGTAHFQITLYVRHDAKYPPPRWYETKPVKNVIGEGCHITFPSPIISHAIVYACSCILLVQPTVEAVSVNTNFVTYVGKIVNHGNKWASWLGLWFCDCVFNNRAEMRAFWLHSSYMCTIHAQLDWLNKFDKQID